MYIKNHLPFLTHTPVGDTTAKMASGSHLSFFLCLTSALLISGTAASCLPGWAELGSRCFIFGAKPSSFADAESVCQRFGAHLASIHNQDEHYFISNLIYQKFDNFPRTWIGLTDAKKEGRFTWTDGSRTDFLPWAPNQPDNYKGNQDCGSMNFHGPVWDDTGCEKKFPFVCARTQ